MPLYFAYGSNLSSVRLRDRLGDVGVIGVALLPRYRHWFDKYGADGTAKGNIVVASNSRVLGVLYQIDEAQLSRLRKFEGGYRQIDVRIECGQTLATAVSFEAITRVSGLAPSREYLGYYEQGMREHGLPDDYRLELLGIYSEHAG